MRTIIVEKISKKDLKILDLSYGEFNNFLKDNYPYIKLKRYFIFSNKASEFIALKEIKDIGKKVSRKYNNGKYLINEETKKRIEVELSHELRKHIDLKDFRFDYGSNYSNFNILNVYVKLKSLTSIITMQVYIH